MGVCRTDHVPQGRQFARRDWELLIAGALWLLFLLNFSALELPSGDEQVQYGFVERLFGDVPHALGYYFGLGLIEAPFYGLGKLMKDAGLQSIEGHSLPAAIVALGLGLLTLIAWPLLASVLKGLGVRHAGFAILAAVLGTPYFYYATFVPGKNHAADGTLFTAVIYLTYRYFSHAPVERWTPYALGVALGLSYTVRYFDGAESVALVGFLLWDRRWWHAAQIALTSAVVCGLLFIIPHAYGVSVFSGGNYSAENVIVFAPLNPLRMLFTNHRGYFVWSPVSALAVIGLVFLWRRRPECRKFLFACYAMGIAVIASYALIPWWDGTWSFSQRFFTPLFPLVAIGLAGLIDAMPRPAMVAAVVAVAWSLFLAFNLVVIGGPQYNSNTPGGATDLALVPIRTHTSVGAYLWGVKHRSNLLR
jgi:Dolichyl-phosphate-mannose-protein mannosyltransferase